MEGARPATPDDVPRLAALNRQAIEELTPLRGGAVFAAREARAEPLEAALRRAVDDADQLVLAGTIDEAPVGYAVGCTEDLRDGSRLGVLGDLYVEPEARGVGVGEAMMDRARAWFAERGCTAIDAVALPGDRSTKNFFEGSGFTARLLVMHHRLTPAADG